MLVETLISKITPTNGKKSRNGDFTEARGFTPEVRSVPDLVSRKRLQKLVPNWVWYRWGYTSETRGGFHDTRSGAQEELSSVVEHFRRTQGVRGKIYFGCVIPDNIKW